MSTASESHPHKSGVSPSVRASNPLVVAWLYNTNGMATWCWEVAHSLHELGQNVLLIVAPHARLPDAPLVEVIRIDLGGEPALPRSRILRAFSNARGMLAANPDGSLQQIHKHLATRGVTPAAYILNQSTLVDPSVLCTQAVAAWSYPVSLFAYLRKLPLLVPDRSLKSLARAAISSIGWWRKDWRGYQTADAVLPVTKALRKALLRGSITCYLAYPGTCAGPEQDRSGGGIRLVMAAVNLNEPRKRILWMLDALKKTEMPQGIVLLLVGEADESLRQAAAQLGFPAEFLGSLKRQELQNVMREADIFCFGSQLDDWGYVLVEAMANGMLPVAPDISPFDEIMGPVGFGYNPQSQAHFLSALNAAVSSSFVEKRREARERANLLFSRAAFGRSVLESIEEVTDVRQFRRGRGNRS